MQVLCQMGSCRFPFNHFMALGIHMMLAIQARHLTALHNLRHGQAKRHPIVPHFFHGALGRKLKRILACDMLAADGEAVASARKYLASEHGITVLALAMGHCDICFLCHHPGLPSLTAHATSAAQSV